MPSIDPLRRFAQALAVLCLLFGEPPGPSQAADSPRSVALRGVLAAPADTCGASHLDRRDLARFYQARSPRPLWVDDTGPLPRSRRLRAVLERSEDEGLPSDRYGLAAVIANWQARTPTAQACLDVLLTTAFDRYGRDLATGMVASHEADRTWRLPPAVSFNALAELRAAPSNADPAARLETLAPAHGLYQRLRTGLTRYRRIADEGGWDTALTGPLLRLGDEREEIRALRERLRREGDLDFGGPAPDRSYDATLTEAVRRFQHRHGLQEDGVVGPRTLLALNTPVDTRIAQLRRAMERLRWMRHDLGDHYVFVNIAGFELAVVEHDRTVLGMRVIVGTADQSTPSFAATLRLLTINPYWNVPHRIARDRLVPRERRSPGYLAGLGFRVQDPQTGQWREPDADLLARSVPPLRQEPGPDNLMGRLSFTLPNPFDVFLHDSPARSLFAREMRACSEGCVRLEHAMALALHALRRAPEWTEERIQEEIDALRHHVLTLAEPIPVYVVYLPSWVDEDGFAHFHPDHYGRETVLEWEFPPGR
ncbi:MAG TPA: L,D-transpeptidase family protein [Methylomirabilota bacterium]